MTTPLFTALHASYTPSSGLFSVKRDCDDLAALIRTILDGKFKDFNPMSVESKGAKKTYWIEFPRIQYHWHPAKVHPATFALELATIANLFSEVYEANK